MRRSRPAVGERFARALAAKDHDGLVGLLADPVDFEALTPRRHWQTTRRGSSWTTSSSVCGSARATPSRSCASVTCGQVADRERVTYRLAVRRAGHRYVVEQHAYFNFDGAPDRLDSASCAPGTGRNQRV